MGGGAQAGKGGGAQAGDMQTDEGDGGCRPTVARRSARAHDAAWRLACGGRRGYTVSPRQRAGW